MRERKIKTYIVKHFEIDAVKNAFVTREMGLLPLPTAVRLARQRAAENAEVRLKYDAKLLDEGFTATEFLAQAYINGARDLDAIDRRIASYELRRTEILNTISYYNEKLARQVEAITSSVVEGEFAEAAE